MGKRGAFEEDAVLAQDEPLGPGEIVVAPPQLGCRQARAVSFVVREAGDSVDAVGGGGRAFMWRELADQVGTGGVEVADDATPGERQ